jgi:hypothetical protein
VVLGAWDGARLAKKSAVPAPEVISQFEALEDIIRLATGAQVRIARRIHDAAVAARPGAQSTAECVAARTGTSVGAAQDLLTTSDRLATQAHADAAVANGELSRDQASIVADAVAADPTAEQGLLDVAQGSSVKDLRAQAATVKANAPPPPEDPPPPPHHGTTWAANLDRTPRHHHP